MFEAVLLSHYLLRGASGMGLSLIILSKGSSDYRLIKMLPKANTLSPRILLCLASCYKNFLVLAVKKFSNRGVHQEPYALSKPGIAYLKCILHYADMDKQFGTLMPC